MPPPPPPPLYLSHLRPDLKNKRKEKKNSEIFENIKT